MVIVKALDFAHIMNHHLLLLLLVAMDAPRRANAYCPLGFYHQKMASERRFCIHDQKRSRSLLRIIKGTRRGSQQQHGYCEMERKWARTMNGASSSSSLNQQEQTKNQGKLHSSNQQQHDQSTIKKKKAQELHDKARALLAEANAAEATLREQKIQDRRKWEIELDVIIKVLENSISNSTYNASRGTDHRVHDSQTAAPTDDNAMAESIRQQQSTSLESWMRVIDRLYEREARARGIILGSKGAGAAHGSVESFMIGNVGGVVSETNLQESVKLRNIMDRMIRAFQQLQDEEENVSTLAGDTKMSSKRRRFSNVAHMLDARLRELRRGEQEEFKRRVALSIASINASQEGQSKEDTIQKFMRRTMADQNITSKSGLITASGLPRRADEINVKKASRKNLNISKFMIDVISLPLWVPPSMVGFIAAGSGELDPEDVKTIRSVVVTGSHFYCTSSDSMRLAAIFRGRFVATRMQRTMTKTRESIVFTRAMNGTEAVSKLAFDEVNKRMRDAGGGLADRVQLFLVDDPEWRAREDIRKEGPNPVILAVPSTVRPDQGRTRGFVGKLFAVISVCATVVTTLAYAVSSYTLNNAFLTSLVTKNDLSVLWSCLPVFIGVVVIHVIHEVAHAVTANATNTKIGLPVPLPSTQIGIFGNITPLRSFPSSRKALLDVALSGPLATLALSLISLVLGITLSVKSSADAIATLPVVPVALFKSSFFIGSLVSFLAPKVLMLPLSQPIPIHPLFMIGLAGLLSTAINLLPVGKLDGGRACTALFGRRSSYVISLLSLVLMAIIALSASSGIVVSWGLLIVLFQRHTEIPLRDEVTEVDDVRFGSYLVLLVVAASILLPFPGGSPL